MTKIFLRMRRIWAEACHVQEWGGGMEHGAYS